MIGAAQAGLRRRLSHGRGQAQSPGSPRAATPGGPAAQSPAVSAAAAPPAAGGGDHSNSTSTFKAIQVTSQVQPQRLVQWQAAGPAGIPVPTSQPEPGRPGPRPARARAT